jgi:hypothetical protein
MVLPFRAQMIAGFTAVIIFVFVLELVRRKHLSEEYSLLWLFMSAGVAVMAFWSTALVAVTKLVGAYSANSVIFFFGLAFVMAILLHFSVRLTRLSENQKNLAQSLALLREQLDKLEKPDSG